MPAPRSWFAQEPRRRTVGRSWTTAARPLHLDQLLNVYADADQQERRELRPILTRKAGDIQKEGDPQRRASLRAALQDALRKGSGAQGTASRRSVAMP